MESIRRARERAGLTQKELAAHLGVDAMQLSRWETGRLTPRLKTAADIADALDISLDELVGRIAATPSERASQLVRELQAILADATETATRLAREVGAPETNGGSAAHG